MKEFFKKLINGIRQRFRELTFYCKFDHLPMSDEEMKEFLKLTKYEE